MSLLLAHHSPWLDVLKRAEASKESIDVLREVIVLQKEIEALPPPSGRSIQEEVDTLSSSDKEEQMTDESFITPPKPTELTTLRSMTLVNGSVQYIDEGYWDGHDEDTQEYQDINRDYRIKSAQADVDKYVLLAAVNRAAEITKDMIASNVPVCYEVELEKCVIQFHKSLNLAFYHHKGQVLIGEDPHEYAMELQDLYWKTFAGRMKTLLRLKYQAIGFDPDVWCK